MHSSEKASLTLAVAGFMIAVWGIAFGPLIVVTGILMSLYGTLSLHRILFGNPHLRALGVRVADTCLRANHAGCQDDPGCTCGCHAERIDLKVS
jgi:hypothetical protein